MKVLTQRIIKDETVVSTVTHIYSETGHFERTDTPIPTSCWHIQLGTNDSIDNYTEVPGTDQHDVPESLPDVLLPDESAEEEATIEDYQNALRELGVDIPGGDSNEES